MPHAASYAVNKSKKRKLPFSYGLDPLGAEARQHESHVFLRFVVDLSQGNNIKVYNFKALDLDNSQAGYLAISLILNLLDIPQM
jgi:hypothetical protein